jgi:hypothetical protein
MTAELYLREDFLPEKAIARIGLGVLHHIVPSPDGKTLLVAGGAGVFLLRTEDFQILWSLPAGKEAAQGAFSSDGSTVAVVLNCVLEFHLGIAGGFGPKCADQAEILILRAADGGLVNILQPEVKGTQGVGSIGLSGDGKNFTSASNTAVFPHGTHSRA